jgi:hypothetical protein
LGHAAPQGWAVGAAAGCMLLLLLLLLLLLPYCVAGACLGPTADPRLSRATVTDMGLVHGGGVGLNKAYCYSIYLADMQPPP